MSDSIVWLALQDLVSPLEAAPTSTSGRSAQQTQVPVLTCLEGLPQPVLVGLCQAGATGRMPLTVALASEKARQHAAGLDSFAWRDLAAGNMSTAYQLECPLCSHPPPAPPLPSPPPHAPPSPPSMLLLAPAVVVVQ